MLVNGGRTSLHGKHFGVDFEVGECRLVERAAEGAITPNAHATEHFLAHPTERLKLTRPITLRLHDRAPQAHTTEHLKMFVYGGHTSLHGKRLLCRVGVWRRQVRRAGAAEGARRPNAHATEQLKLTQPSTLSVRDRAS